MRKRGKVDDNQNEIVRRLRDLGCTVVSIAGVGKGTPDLLVGFRGKNWLLELKDGKKPPSQRKLTQDERDFINGWCGQVDVVVDFLQAIDVVTERNKKHARY